VPPPAELVLDLMSDFERFLHDQPTRTPTLVKAALAHMQFETIHPFLDGNGRLGRLLITLLLCENGVLQQPILYLSLYLKANRQTYYDLLQRVRLEGVWEVWLEFFLAGVLETATQAVTTSRAILELLETDRLQLEGLNRASSVALQVHMHSQRKLYTSAPQLVTLLGISLPTALEKLEGLGIVQETTGKARDRIWVYGNYLALLETGIEVRNAPA
jgi:Fic family protein